MSSNSNDEIDEEFLDSWLSQQNLPTDVPLQMKILAFAGHISLRLTKAKKPRGRPKKEFSDYKLPKMFRDLIGILKISFTVMLQFDDSNLIIIGSLGIVILMLGAVATHLKVKSPPKTMLPALTMLSIGLIILLHTLGQVQ